MITGNYKELDDAIRLKIPKYVKVNTNGDISLVLCCLLGFPFHYQSNKVSNISDTCTMAGMASGYIAFTWLALETGNKHKNNNITGKNIEIATTIRQQQ